MAAGLRYDRATFGLLARVRGTRRHPSRLRSGGVQSAEASDGQVLVEHALGTLGHGGQAPAGDRDDSAAVVRLGHLGWDRDHGRTTLRGRFPAGVLSLPRELSRRTETQRLLVRVRGHLHHRLGPSQAVVRHGEVWA